MPGLDDLALKLLNGRHIAALATQNSDGSIHLTAVWYLYRDGRIYVATNSGSRKYRNVAARPIASLMIDSRQPGYEQGTTISGTASVVQGKEVASIRRQVHQRFLTNMALSDPAVSSFYEASDDGIICIMVESFVSWDIAKMNTARFGGILGTDTGYLYPLD